MKFLDLHEAAYSVEFFTSLKEVFKEKGFLRVISVSGEQVSLILWMWLVPDEYRALERGFRQFLLL